MTEQLENKIALFLQMMRQDLNGMRGFDKRDRNGFFDDAEVLDWLDALDRAGRLVNVRYLSVRNV